MIIVQTNCDTRKEAQDIGRALLKDKLASVAHVHQVRSSYLWKGNIIEGKEFILTVKTLEANANAVIQAVEKLHSYQVPPIIAFPASQTTQGYLELTKKELLK